MKDYDMSHAFSAIRMANEVIEMHEEILRLRDEVAYYKPYEQKYMDSIRASIDHSHNLICNTLQAVMDHDSRFNKGERAMKQLAAMENAQ